MTLSTEQLVSIDQDRENYVPDDITLGEMKESNSMIFDTLCATKMEISYVDQHGNNYPDDMEICDFLNLDWKNKGRVVMVLERG